MSSISDYKQYSQREHILARPDMYIGEKGVKKSKEVVFDGVKLLECKVEYSTAVLKMFDEAITNATDNIERHLNNHAVDHTTDIRVEINDEWISVWNNGFSIPIEEVTNTKGEVIYLPQMVFGELNSSSNYDDSKSRERNGCNGVGIKLVNIFSTKFYVEIVNDGQLYRQLYTDNMSVVGEPRIEETDSIDYVYIKFWLDYKKFGVDVLDSDTMMMLYKRVYDTSLFNVHLELNRKQLKPLNFKEFCLQHLIAKKMKVKEEDLIFEDRGRIKLCYLPYSKSYVKSYVNHIETSDHGKHVDNFFKDLDSTIKTVCKLKDKTGKNNSILFIDMVVNQPTFSSQSKTKLTTPCNVNYKDLCKDILKNTNLLEYIQNKTISKLNKKNKVKKPYFERLEDANYAGTSKSNQCTLFVCEGLSAASMVSSGFGVLGHDLFGIYSLTGKILNVAKASEEKTDKNIVLTQLMQTLGLEYGREYNDLSSLRYGRIICMKDADTDGSAIMGLLLNFFYTHFKSILELNNYDFFYEFITPQIQVITKQNKKVEFYNKIEYEEWFEEHDKEIKSIKYLKGLASNSSQDTLKYFREFEKYLIPIRLDKQSDYNMSMAYGAQKKYIELRKKWVQSCKEDTYLPRVHSEPISITPFIRYDLVLFSHESCTRSIPNIYDGLKPTQRKILYTLFNMPDKEAYKLRKVFELTAKTAEKAQYHHGDSSLNGTIMAMMQTWSGSNNIPLLGHEGFIGSRFGLGQDGGAPRYVYACLNKISRFIFPKIDDELLTNIVEDGVVVEPKYYLPIIPMVLINGTNGIGTGYSSYVPLHNYHQIIDILKETLGSNLNETEVNNEEELNIDIKEFSNINCEENLEEDLIMSKEEITDKILQLVNNYKNVLKSKSIDLYYPEFKGTFEKNEIGYTSNGCFEWIVPDEKRGFFRTELKYDKGSRSDKNPFAYDPCFLKITEIPISQIGFTNMINKIKELLSKKNTNDKKTKKQENVYLIDFKNNSITGNDSQEEKIELYLKFTNDGQIEAEELLKEIRPLKYSETVSTNNMYLFDEHIQIHKYETIYDIMNKFIQMRYYLYYKRKNMLLNREINELTLLKNKARFIKMVVDKTIDIKTMSIEKLNQELKAKKFILHEKSYKYLIDMPIRWMTKEKYDSLLEDIKNREKKIEELKEKKLEEMWLEDLELLEKELK